MGSTVTLVETIAWAQPFLNYAPVAIGTSNEPAITSANTILQTILSPPFAWRWNRQTTTFNTTAGTQDYSESIANFGFAETGSVAATNQPTMPLEIKTVLTEGTEQGRPTFVSTQKDDGAGHITFRLLPVPDGVYTITLNWQSAPTLFNATSGTWAPIPDQFEFIYNWGFLSLMLDFNDSSKAQRIRQLFVASLLGASEGLSEADKNLFTYSWLGDMRQQQAGQLFTQVGNQGRAV